MIELKNRKSVKSGGTLVAGGIEDGWITSNDGSYIYYSEVKGKDKQDFVYSVSEQKAYSITTNSAQTFFPPEGDIVYFIKENSGKTQLHRMRIGEEAEYIETVSKIRSFTDAKKLEIFYTVNAGNQHYDFYKISGADKPVIISKDISEVFLDKYVVGGNLYYCSIKASEKQDWSDFVDDPYAESDANMSKPDKGSFLKTEGWILKRSVVDEKAYSAALEEYNKKILRDDIREELGKLDVSGGGIDPEYKLKVYDGKTSKDIVNSVKLENIVGFAETGTPAVIYKRTTVRGIQTVSMDDLYKAAFETSPAEAVDRIRESIVGNEISNGYKYAWYNGTKVFEYDFNPEYNAAKAEYIFTGREGFFAAVKDGSEKYSTLYYSAVKEAVAKETEAAQGVVSYEKSNDRLYIKVAENDKNDALYVLSSDGSHKKITDRYIRFYANEKTADLILLLYEEDGSDVSLAVYKGNEVSVIDDSVDENHVSVKDNKVAYIKNYQTAAASDNSVQSGGEMKIYTGEKTRNVDTEVSNILDFK